MSASASKFVVPRLSWPRIGALAGTLSIHLYLVALLLIPPAAMLLLRHAETAAILVHVISVPKALAAQAEPVLPAPAKREIRHTSPQPVATVPLNDRPGAVVVPAGTETVLAVEQAGSNTPAETAPTALAYGTRTPVPYPRDAMRRHEQGTVVLRVLVGADGVPQIVEVESSSGSPRLDNAARDAVMHWRFQPGTRGGAAHGAWARVPIAFDLSSL